MPIIKKNVSIIMHHEIVLEGMKFVIKATDDYEHVLGFSSCNEFLSILPQTDVDIVILDMDFDNENSLIVCKEIKLRRPSVYVLGMGYVANRNLILDLLQNGASGYLLKAIPVNEMLNKLKSVASGELALSEKIKDLLIGSLSKQNLAVPILTNREKDLLRLLGQGKTTSNIADELYLSPYTIDTYRKNLLKKFKVKNTSELLMFVTKEDLM